MSDPVVTPCALAECAGAASFLQSDMWGVFKAKFGWDALSFKINLTANLTNDTNGKENNTLLVLTRKLAPGVAFAYVPWGPEAPEAQGASSKEQGAIFPATCCLLPATSYLSSLSLALKPYLPKNVAFIRFDPPWYSEGADAPAPEPGAPFVRASADVQPPDTVLVDLRPPTEEIAAAMKPKWRYNARLALKKGVTVKRTGVEDIGVFYALLKETSARDGIAIHSEGYYKTLFEVARGCYLYLAYHEGGAVAGIVVLFRGETATYLYGASSDRKRNLMAPYALQVQAMEDAKAAGCETYDLFGIPPDDDPSHPMHGLYRFKTGFGGKIIHRPGSWDYPLRPAAYRLFRFAEAARKKLRDRKKRRQG